MTALETMGLGRRYRRTWALRDCSATVPAGRVVSLVGPNGAGKTTLLHLAMGMLSPNEGEVRVFGRPGRESLERVAFMTPCDFGRVTRPSRPDLVKISGQNQKPSWWPRIIDSMPTGSRVTPALQNRLGRRPAHRRRTRRPPEGR